MDKKLSEAYNLKQKVDIRQEYQENQSIGAKKAPEESTAVSTANVFTKAINLLVKKVETSTIKIISQAERLL